MCASRELRSIGVSGDEPARNIGKAGATVSAAIRLWGMPNSELHRRTLHSANYTTLQRRAPYWHIRLLPRGPAWRPKMEIIIDVIATPRDASKQGGQDRARTLSAAARSSSQRRSAGIILAQNPFPLPATLTAPPRSFKARSASRAMLPETVANRPRAALCIEAPPVGQASASCRHARASHKGRNAHIER